jgi:hypothetical protein
MARRRADGRVVRALGIGILIFGIVHVPLPQADYHNIRHHDGPGEVCPYHDHLLRWHPSASSDDDVSLLHWHWFVPQGELGDHQERTGDVNRGPISGPVLHAHLPSSLLPDWPGELVTRLDSRCRLGDQLTLAVSTLSSVYNSGDRAALISAWRHRWAGGRRSSDGLRAERTAIFQRWNC